MAVCAAVIFGGGWVGWVSFSRRLYVMCSPPARCSPRSRSGGTTGQDSRSAPGGGAPALPGQRMSGFAFSAAARRLGRRSLVCFGRTTPVAAIPTGACSLRGNRPGDRCRRAGPLARVSSRARTVFARSRSGRRSSRTRRPTEMLRRLFGRPAYDRHIQPLPDYLCDEWHSVKLSVSEDVRVIFPISCAAAALALRLIRAPFNWSNFALLRCKAGSTASA